MSISERNPQDIFPAEVWELIGTYLSRREDASNFARVCQRLHALVMQSDRIWSSCLQREARINNGLQRMYTVYRLYQFVNPRITLRRMQQLTDEQIYN